MAEARLTALHRRRLRELWRSAGWPCQDMVEVELLSMRMKPWSNVSRAR
jgi:hypothetical protein